MFNKLKLFLFTVICLVVGISLLTHDVNPTPAFKDLDVVEGVAETRIFTRPLARGGEYKYCAITIGDHRMKYLGWFNEGRPLGYGVSTGDHLKIWTDLDDERLTWQIVNGDRTVVEYERVLAATKKDNFIGRIVGGCFTATGLIIVLVWLLLSPNMPWNVAGNYASSQSRRHGRPRTARHIRVN